MLILIFSPVANFGQQPILHLKLSDGTAAVKNFFFINEISSPWLLLGALFEHILCGKSTHEKVAFSFG